ncbi:MAG: NUDIX hydrolase [Bacillota bacterium]
MGYVEDIRKLVGHKPIILVGAVVIILDRHGNILMQQRTHPYGVWGLPGGLMELGESTEETAKREVMEETGLIVDKLELIDVFSGRDYFCVAQNGDEFFVVTVAYSTREYRGDIKADIQEALQLSFFPINELPEKIVRSHKNIINKYLSKIS